MVSTAGTSQSIDELACSPQLNKGKPQDAYQSTIGARAIVANYVKANSPKAISKKGGWLRPPMGFVKLNVDASF